MYFKVAQRLRRGAIIEKYRRIQLKKILKKYLFKSTKNCPEVLGIVPHNQENMRTSSFWGVLSLKSLNIFWNFWQSRFTFKIYLYFTLLFEYSTYLCININMHKGIDVVLHEGFVTKLHFYVG